jgi:hypothetical protein
MATARLAIRIVARYEFLSSAGTNSATRYGSRTGVMIPEVTFRPSQYMLMGI